MERISIKRALSEIKDLDCKIIKLIDTSEFITVARKKSSKTEYVSKDEFERRARNSYSTIQSLIKRKELLKSRVVESNAITKVTVCGMDMTVAEAIDIKKNSIKYRKYMLGYFEYFLKAKYSFEILKLIDNRADASRLGYRLFGKDEENRDKVEAFAKDYMAKHPIGTVDPLNLEKLVETERAFINEFENTVDDILYISSCTTFINI